MVKVLSSQNVLGNFQHGEAADGLPFEKEVTMKEIVYTEVPFQKPIIFRGKTCPVRKLMQPEKKKEKSSTKNRS